MKMSVIVQGSARFDLDAEFAEPAIREAIEDGCNDVASQVIDYTDSERSDIDRDEYVTVTEDDGAVLWQGWLNYSKRDDPPPVDRDALEQLAASWQKRAAEFREAAKRDPMAEITDAERCQRAIAHHFAEHARELLAAIGAKP